MVLKTVSTLGASGGGGGGGTPGGANTEVQFNNSGSFGGSANLTWDGANVQVGSSGLLKFSNGVTTSVGFKAPAIIPANVAWTLPSTDGTAGQFIITNGSGTLSWASANLTPVAPTNYSLPIVSGTTTVGQTLSSTTGGWNGYPSPTYAYQWVRGVSNIGGATSATYPLVDADYNNTIKVIVTATNSAGSANATSAATATVAGTVPGAPTIGTATAGNAQAAVAFTAPAVTGGPSITSYTATSSPGGITGSAASSPIIVSGLTNGTAYTFTVTATNSIGTSAASAASNSVTPTAIVQDASFAYVPLLLETTSTNGQQNNTFLDSSTNNFTITRNGTPTQGSVTPYWPDGQWSNYFNGSSTLNLATNAIPASGAFTFETFVYVTGTAASQCIAAQYPNGTASGRLMILWNDTANKFTVILGASTVFVSDATYSANSWLYLVVQRDASNVWSMYVNGTRNTATVSSATAIDTAVTYIGNRNTGGTPYTGYISNLRVVSSALYSGSTISVPTTPFSVSTANQTLLTCYSNRFIDANTATAAKTITVTGTPSVQAFQPFSPAASYSAATYAGSGFLPTSSDYLSIAADATFTFGTQNHTIEFWAYQIAFTDYSTFWNYASGATVQGTGNYYISNGGLSSNLLLGSGGAWGVNIAFTKQTLNAWHHYAITRSGSSFALFIDGVRAGTATYAGSITSQAGAMLIGRGTGTNDTFQGYISNLRIVKGVAIYDPAQTTITVPTTPVTNTAQTSLLLNMANAGIYDAAAQNVITTVGNAQVSTAQYQWSPSSMAFDGTGDWLTAVDSPQLQLGTGDFTIEGWFYLAANGTAYGIVSKGAASTGWSVNVTSGNRIQFSYTASNLTGATTTLAASTWYYVAVVRSGSATGNLKIYINGALEVTSGGAVTDNFNQTNILYVGASRTGTTPLNGYIQDLRITNGVARTITASPTAAFPVQ